MDEQAVHQGFQHDAVHVGADPERYLVVPQDHVLLHPELPERVDAQQIHQNRERVSIRESYKQHGKCPRVVQRQVEFCPFVQSYDIVVEDVPLLKSPRVEALAQGPH